MWYSGCSGMCGMYRKEAVPIPYLLSFSSGKHSIYSGKKSHVTDWCLVIFGIWFKRWKVDKKQLYTKTETCELFLDSLRIFLSDFIKIDPYNFELYAFKIGAFVLRHSVVYNAHNLLVGHKCLTQGKFTEDRGAVKPRALNCVTHCTLNFTTFLTRIGLCSVLRPR